MAHSKYDPLSTYHVAYDDMQRNYLSNTSYNYPGYNSKPSYLAHTTSVNMQLNMVGIELQYVMNDRNVQSKHVYKQAAS